MFLQLACWLTSLRHCPKQCAVKIIVRIKVTVENKKHEIFVNISATSFSKTRVLKKEHQTIYLTPALS
jgi:hypothetical protein